jgi:antitoxin component YwqK of YwqJK toxin-antitoxin module
MNSYIFILSLLFSAILSQNNIDIKQFSIFKNKYEDSIDLEDYIDEYNGNYILKLISINEVDYERKKKIILELCDVDFKISSNLSEISVKRCDHILEPTGELVINDNSSIISFNTSKYRYMEFNLLFWVYGSFNEKSDISMDDGLMKEYYNNGNIKLEYNFKNGKKNGVQKKWFDNNQISIIYNYNNGNLTGLQKKWYKNGQIKSEMNYYNNILDGIYKYWYSNGQIKFVKNYKNGNLIEILENYDIDGNSQ